MIFCTLIRSQPSATRAYATWFLSMSMWETVSLSKEMVSAIFQNMPWISYGPPPPLMMHWMAILESASTQMLKYPMPLASIIPSRIAPSSAIFLRLILCRLFYCNVSLITFWKNSIPRKWICRDATIKEMGMRCDKDFIINHYCK